MLEQILESQTKLVVEFNGKFDAVYIDLNGKIDNLSSHLKKLDVQVAQTTQSIKRQEGFLPGNPDANPRKSCNAILIREGDDVWEELDTEDELELAVAEMVSTDTLMYRSTPYGMLFSEMTQYDGVDRYPSSIDRHWIRTAPCEVQVPMQLEPVYTPHVPYPRRRRSKQEIHVAKCTTIMEKILHILPTDASETSSASLNRYVKQLVDNGISSDEAKLLTRDICAIMLPKAKKEKAQRVDIAEYIRTITPGLTTEKLPDPGSFVLDCSISTSRFSRSLCDLGSSINLMSKSVVERLGMTQYRPTRITLLFADRSKRISEGILEDVPVKVGNSIIPADFVVLDYEKEPKNPLILGRAFLATAAARFDVKRGRIFLKVCDSEMEFGMDSLELTKPISCIASSTDTPPQTDQNPTTEPHTTLHPVQLANESCRATVSIDTTTSVDRHPRVSQTEDSAHSLQPTPLEDLCDKFSSISSPSLSLIISLDYSKTASQDNKPRVPRKLVSPVVFADDEKSVDRHTTECRSTPVAAPTRSVYTPPWKARMQQQSTPPLHPHPKLRQVKLLTPNKRLVGGNPLVLFFFSLSFIFFYF
ncbi:putative athila-like protein [Arabidopsis thaliana]|nr:putative athila-like protein [Arabidopsis thaliana]